MLSAMPPIRLCADCEQCLTRASEAVRRHAEEMYRATSSVEKGLSEEQVDNYKIRLIASFNDAQAAWDSYREHLKEHGILPVIPSAQV